MRGLKSPFCRLKQRKWKWLTGATLLLLLVTTVVAQPPQMRQHTATKAQEVELVAADQEIRFENRVVITEADGVREIRVNQIPAHKVGQFPNPGNPNRIKPIVKTFKVTMSPQKSRRLTGPRPGLNFGIGLNGVPFDPGAGEFWQGNPRSGWIYEALGGAVPLGLDANHAHVQPSGKYHYHGLPTGLLEHVGLDRTKHSPLIGWAADGFPIYALTGYYDPNTPDSGIKVLESSYRLKSGQRPGDGQSEPDGSYDGAFVQDFEYVEGLGDLDECNGRDCVTPEFPEGTYAYFLTDDWPVVPRLLRGEPDPSFEAREGGPGGGRRGGPPGSGPPGGRGERGGRRGPPMGPPMGPPPRHW